MIDSGMNTTENSVSGALSLRVSIAAFFGLFVAAVALAVITANECHYNLLLKHVHASYTPSLLYGLISWLWWIGLLLALWLPAESRSRLLRFSFSSVLIHAGLASLFGIAHLVLLQYEVRMASAHWPAWGSLYSSLRVMTPWRFGVDLLIYALIYSFSGFSTFTVGSAARHRPGAKSRTPAYAGPAEGPADADGTAFPLQYPECDLQPRRART